jgi:hypothetical protein
MLIKELVYKVKEMEGAKKELLQSICCLRGEDFNSLLKVYKTIENYVKAIEKDERISVKMLTKEFVTVTASFNTLMNSELRDLIKKGFNSIVYIASYQGMKIKQFTIMDVKKGNCQLHELGDFIVFNKEGNEKYRVQSTNEAEQCIDGLISDGGK